MNSLNAKGGIDVGGGVKSKVGGASYYDPGFDYEEDFEDEEEE